MAGLFDWLGELENKFFALHVGFVLVASVLAELFFAGLTTFLYPAVLLVATASFLYNYPVSAIKDHGLFAQYLIELRVLWAVILGVFVEYVVYQFFEKSADMYMGIALLVGIVVLFYCHNTLQEKIVKARGFK